MKKEKSSKHEALKITTQFSKFEIGCAPSPDYMGKLILKAKEALTQGGQEVITEVFQFTEKVAKMPLGWAPNAGHMGEIIKEAREALKQQTK